jgi:hypothetical protein
MPKYYFNIAGGTVVADTEGTELADVNAARVHARKVADELMHGRTGMMGSAWSDWTMIVTNDAGAEVLSFHLAEKSSHLPS